MGHSYNSNVYAPVSVAADHTWADVSTNGTIVYGLKKDGTIWLWGTDINSDLYMRSYEERWSSAEPIMIGKDNDWEKISAGGSSGEKFFVAIKKDGSW